MNCEMCGKSTENLYNTKVEGITLKLCRECSSFGTVVSKVYAKPKIVKKRIPEKKPEIIEQIVQNYGILVKNAREKMGLKQDELAKKINEKESLIHHIETGKKEPSMQLARKLEKFLNIKLVEVEENILADVIPKKKSGPLTIGDVIKVRKR